MKINKIEAEIDRNDVMELLTMESGGFDYWCTINCKESDYIKTRDLMEQRGVEPCIGDHYCYEEVLAYMICETDFPVSAYDFTYGEDYRLTPEMIKKGFELNALNRPQDANLEEGDAETGDAILQYACLGDIIYG